MKLPTELRDVFVEELDTFLAPYSDSPNPEAAVGYVIEMLETYADEHAIDDFLTSLEENGELDAPLKEVLEEEMSSNDEFEITGEEVISLLEQLCGIEWDSSNDDDDDEEEEDEDEDEI